jgi:TolA-binding protein
MNRRRAAARMIAGALIVAAASTAQAQRAPEVRRAQPIEDPPVARALPIDEPTATPRPHRSTPPAASPDAQPPLANDAAPPAPPAEEEAADKRQLDYANALFARKLYDLAVPEYEKFLGQFPGAAGRASAAFYLGECYRSLNKSAAARTSFQLVLDNYGDSEFAGPAAYGVAEILFTQKNYAGALPLFHRSAGKSKEPALALSARYFEARCLENLDKKDEALNTYQQVIDAKNPNPYREDSRLAAGTIAVARGRKADAFRNYEALSNETQKPALKAEATVRAGMAAVDLIQPEKGKIDKGMADKAMALLQKGRTLPEAGRWRAIAQVGLLRLLYQSGQFDKVLTEYKRGQDTIPEEVRPEMMLVVANSQRQLGHAAEADEAYRQIVEKFPAREEAKDAQYQRLINFYNSDSPSLVAEIDSYLQSNPTPERADQAKLLKAEFYYKKGQFADAAPLYAELRASQLSARLRAESAYKLGWCFVQQKDGARAIESFSYFLKAFPDAPQVASALTQRALAYQENKNYDEAIADLNQLLTKYPAAREREAALQQKALLQGQQDNPAAMAETFRQLLKEFPKTSVAAQANYYIGKAAFDLKDYKGALPALDAARRLDKQQYFNLATLRIISSFFYLKDRAALTREVDSFIAADPNGRVPAEILEWLGIEYYNEKNYPAAERYLTLLSKSENLSGTKPDFWFYLADTESRLKKFAEAEMAYQQYIQVATDPAAKAKALLALGATKIAAHKPDDAQKIAEEIMKLQPEGRVNAEARLLAGDVQLEREHFEDAGKAFMGVALLYDDPAITPRALQKAALAYDRAGRKDEADRLTRQLREKYPNYAGG